MDAAASAAAAEAAAESAQQLDRLLEAKRLLQAHQPAAAIEGPLAQVIAFYEGKYLGSDRVVYCARWMPETLLYMLGAAKDGKPAIALNTFWSDAYYLRGYALQELGRLDDGLAALSKALALAPRNAQYRGELAQAYTRKKDWNHALDEFKTAAQDATEFSPPDVKNIELNRARRGLGYVYVELGRLNEAKATYEECLRLDPADRSAQAELRYVQSLIAKAAANTEAH